MTQLSLLSPPRRPRKAGHVPRSSVLAYQERPRDKRVADVVSDLTHRQVWEPQTSAELAAWMNPRGGMENVLYVRRGLSDALALGLVEHAPARKCAVSGRVCLTWRVVSR